MAEHKLKQDKVAELVNALKNDGYRVVGPVEQAPAGLARLPTHVDLGLGRDRIAGGEDLRSPVGILEPAEGLQDRNP